MATTVTVYRWRIPHNRTWRTTPEHHAESDVRQHCPRAIRIDSTWRVLPADAVERFTPPAVETAAPAAPAAPA